MTPAEQRLKEVTQMLKKANQETLTADLQNFVVEETKATTRVETKELHSAVKVLGKARDALDEAMKLCFFHFNFFCFKTNFFMRLFPAIYTISRMNKFTIFII